MMYIERIMKKQNNSKKETENNGLFTLLANYKIMTFETYYQHIKNDLEEVNIKCPTKAYIRRLWQMAYTVEQAVHSITYDE